MELNNVNGTNGVNKTSQKPNKREEEHDNSFQGETVTMDTPNPAEILGRSMVLNRKQAEASDIENISTAPTESDTPNFPKPKTNYVKSYYGKSKLFAKGLAHKLSKMMAPGLEPSLSDEEIADYKRQIEEIKQDLFTNPQNFIDCSDDETEQKEIIENFFNSKTYDEYDYSKLSTLKKIEDFFDAVSSRNTDKNLSLITALNVFGRETVELLLSKGILNAEAKISDINDMSKNKLLFLKSYLNTMSVDNKPLTPEQKLEIYDLFHYYRMAPFTSATKKLKENLTDDKVDLKKLRTTFIQHYCNKNLNQEKGIIDIANKLIDKKVDLYDFKKLHTFLRILNRVQTGGDYFRPTREACINILHNVKESFDCIDATTNFGERLSKNPEKYVNGKQSKATQRCLAECFFELNNESLFLTTYMFGKETADVLLRKRLNFIKGFFQDKLIFSRIDEDSIKMIRNLSHSKNIDGKPFTPSEKLEFIYLVGVYKNNQISFEKMQKMIDEGKVDVMQLKVDILHHILKNIGLSDSEISRISKEKLLSWNIEYLHLIPEVSDIDEYQDVIKAACLEDFETYIHDNSNAYGKANSITQKKFNDLNMDYEKWIHPSKEHEINFVTNDKTQEQLSQIVEEITKQMNMLMQTRASGHIKKQFPDCIKGEEFVIPAKYTANKTELKKFITLLTDNEHSKMNAVWNRAKLNAKSDNSNIAAIAQNTLTKLFHLNQSLEILENFDDSQKERAINFKIKMWDRIPQKDLFQGNYSTCCIGLDGVNRQAMPHYLMDTAFNMIEIVDNDSGKTIGNALCYFVQTKDGKPAFAIDNIEISYHHNRFSRETAKNLRNSVAQYAASIAKDVTGSDDIHIFIGDSYNDLSCDDIPLRPQKISFIGDIDVDCAYLDMYGGWKDKNGLKGHHMVRCLK